TRPWQVGAIMAVARRITPRGFGRRQKREAEGRNPPPRRMRLFFSSRAAPRSRAYLDRILRLPRNDAIPAPIRRRVPGSGTAGGLSPGVLPCDVIPPPDPDDPRPAGRSDAALELPFPLLSWERRA